MGFLESFFAWLIITLVVAIIVYVSFSYILGWFYPQEEDTLIQREVEIGSDEHHASLETEPQHNEKIKRQRLIAIFIFVVMAILMAGSGVSSYMATMTNDG